MLIDTTAIARAEASAETGGHPATVWRESTSVVWPDGSTLELHLVNRWPGCGADTYSRAVLLHGLGYVLFDSCELCPALKDEFIALPPMDHAGLLYHSLRLGYPNAAAVLAKVTSALVGREGRARRAHQLGHFDVGQAKLFEELTCLSV